MKIFLSWSKDQSRAIAEVFRDWLPKVIQGCRDPYMSTETTKGDTWFISLTEALATAKVGVVFITPANQHETWLNFESGALLTKLDKQRLCPVLVGLTKSNYDGPLKNLQLTEFEDKEDMRRLLNDMNKECDVPLDASFLHDEFDHRWADLQDKARAALTSVAPTPGGSTKKKTRTTEEKIDELLELVRETRTSNSLLMASTSRLIEASFGAQDRHTAAGVPIRTSDGPSWLTADGRLRHSSSEVLAKRLKAYGGPYVSIDGNVVGEAVDIMGNLDNGLVTYKDIMTGKIDAASLKEVTFGTDPF
ncbi:hypothetical protein CMMCAS08_11140 [Clavibacter michiganensis subsp. michiganensis]|uniref:TIR domain-containing protein n=1 Tax=Clavibacter michiganensis TaxID=28447 RepID=UPI000B66FAE5|nr:TIR domain-containing protein [Clavibacter michiganensis]OUE03250.1 hypothetical protein CMMCAS08_11140 [Clavibacter michiganensis subsp. michiganensis]